jgi:hypothetical protein
LNELIQTGGGCIFASPLVLIGSKARSRMGAHAIIDR